MRIRPFWIAVCGVLGCAGSASAQGALVSVSEEVPRVEVSVGAAAMYGGAGADFERQFRQLGFDAPDGRIELPHTAAPAPLPGVFAQAHVAAGAHAMVGFLISDVETDTEGRPPGGAGASMRADVLTRALILSYRPNAWLKIGAGPALHRRSAGFVGHPSFRDDAVGWVGSGEAKFARSHRSAERRPAFGYVLGQYRRAPALDVPSMPLPAQGVPTRARVWDAQRVRTSHWAFGVGIGLEM